MALVPTFNFNSAILSLYWEPIKELIADAASSIKIRDQALKDGYRPLYIDALGKVVNGFTTIEEVNKKLALY